MGSNYYAYPVNDSNAPKLTDAPKGYVPFHIEHYGRHGSRWLIGGDAYTKAIKMLTPAEKSGKLTTRGEKLMTQLRSIAKAAKKRDGELTEIGAEQHRGIARRMYANFPEVFSKNACVDARSTTVQRCMLSMANELQELKAANPNLRVKFDASEADMRYMNYHDTIARYLKPRTDSMKKAFNKKHRVGKGYLSKIFSDTQYAKDSINSDKLFDQLFKVVINTGSHTNIESYYDIFSKKEFKNKWLQRNFEWYLRFGNSSLTDYKMPLLQTNLVHNIIESADTAIASGNNSANLRFGHDVIVLPLATFLELDDYAVDINDPEEVAAKWHNYEIVPMACNVQIIFYRPEKGKATADNTLVKVLLNEREVKLPIDTKNAPYYSWAKFRKYYVDKLAKFGR